MEDVMLLQAVEKYLRDEMTPEEKVYFETLRKTNPEVDLMVVEHSLFLQQLDNFSERKNFKSTLQHSHTELTDKGDIKPASLEGKAKVLYLWNRYKRVAAIAASIAIVTTLGVSMLVNTLSPKTDSAKLQELGREIKKVKDEGTRTKQEVNQIKGKIAETTIPFRTAGTGFMIDGKGLLITNAHIVRNARNIFIINKNNDQYRASVVFTDVSKDVAVLNNG
jgi:serine protease Do